MIEMLLVAVAVDNYIVYVTDSELTDRAQHDFNERLKHRWGVFESKRHSKELIQAFRRLYSCLCDVGWIHVHLVISIGQVDR